MLKVKDNNNRQIDWPRFHLHQWYRYCTMRPSARHYMIFLLCKCISSLFARPQYSVGQTWKDSSRLYIRNCALIQKWLVKSKSVYWIMPYVMWIACVACLNCFCAWDQFWRWGSYFRGWASFQDFKAYHPHSPHILICSSSCKTFLVWTIPPATQAIMWNVVDTRI